MERGSLSLGRGAVALVLAVAIGCGSFGSSDDSSPSPSPSPDAGDADAGANREDGGVTDAPVDAAVEAGCRTAIDEHFATELPSPVLWVPNEKSGTVDYSSTQGKLALGALHAAVVQSDAGTRAYVERPLEGIPTSAKLSFAMRAAPTQDQYLDVGCALKLQGKDNTSFLAIHPYVINGALYMGSNAKLLSAEFEAGSSEAAVGMLQPTHWYSVEIAAQWVEPTVISFVAEIDTVRVINRKLNLPEATKDVFVTCGIGYGDPGEPADVFVDDVVLNACQ